MTPDYATEAIRHRTRAWRFRGDARRAKDPHIRELYLRFVEREEERAEQAERLVSGARGQRAPDR